MWARFTERLGHIWGATTTLVLALTTGVLPVLQGIDPDFIHAHPMLMWAMLILGVVAAVARVVAPPPPSVAIHPNDMVEVDHSAGTVTVTKESPVSDAVMARADVVKP